MTFSAAIGRLPDQWTTAPLKELTLKIGSGATPRGGASTYLARREEHALIRSQCVHERKFDLDALSFISPDQARGLRSVEVQEGDLLLNITGDGVTFGRCCLAPRDAFPAVVNQHVAIIRPDRSKLAPGFLLSFLTHPDTKPYIESFNAGGSRRAITKGHIESFEIPLPPIAEQSAISSLLLALDDKIELNRRMSATLEEMARALYRSWFVDFDPVHARALGQSPEHMHAAAAALFPDSFSPGGLPKGWEWRSLDNIADFLNGAALQKFPPENGAESLPVIKIAELRSGITPKSGRAGLQVPEKYKVSNGDVLFSWSGSLLQKVWTEGPGALNQHLFKVTSDMVPKWFHFFAVDQHMEEFRQVAASKATTMGHIQRHHLKEAMVAMPGDEAIIDAAGEAIGPAFDRAITADLENQALAALRDTLLPRLMSGELRIREAEKQVEELV